MIPYSEMTDEFSQWLHVDVKMQAGRTKPCSLLSLINHWFGVSPCTTTDLNHSVHVLMCHTGAPNPTDEPQGYRDCSYQGAAEKTKRTRRNPFLASRSLNRQSISAISIPCPGPNLSSEKSPYNQLVGCSEVDAHHSLNSFPSQKKIGNRAIFA